MQEEAVSRSKYSRQLNVLETMKDLVRRYRAGEKGLFGEDIIYNYLQASQILADNQNEIITNVLSTVSANLKEKIAEYFPKVADLRKVELSQILINMASPQAIQEFQKAVMAMENLKKDFTEKTKALSSLSTKPVKSKVTTKKLNNEVELQDSPIITQIKAEIRAIIARKFKDDKAKRVLILKQLEQAKSIKVSASKDGWCKLEVDSISEELKTRLYYTQTRSSVTNKVIYSNHGKIGLETFNEIKNSKGRTLYTAYGESEKKKGKQAQQQDKREKQKETELVKKQEKLKSELDEIQHKMQELAAQAPKILKSLVLSLDNYEFFVALAQDNEKGAALLEGLFSPYEVPKIQDELRQQALHEVIFDKNVWSLYETPKDKGHSYYQKLVAGLIDQRKISEIVKSYFDSYSADIKSNQNDIINQIAGLNIPHAVAKDIFLQEVFEYGMGLRAHDSFSKNNFDTMNQILQNNGYRITFDHYKIDKTCQEAKPESANVLTYMHEKGPKDIKNKKIGLLLRIGEILQKDKGDIILLDTFSGDGKELLNLFVSIYYEDKGDHSSYWQNFIKNNKSLAKEVYQIFAGQPNIDVRKCAQRLCRGEYIKEAKQDIHHIFTRKYAGLFNNAELEFNHPSILASTISFHIADADPHLEAHLFDTKAIYMVYENNQYAKRNSIKGVGTESILAIPQLEKRGLDGKFHPIIEPDTLFVTSLGKVVKEPQIAVSKPKSKLLSQKIVVKDNSYTKSK